MPSSILTLTTDFGLSDHFVGAMKGVTLSICPDARIVDISHEVEPYQISDGAYVIGEAYRYFPKGTVHVVVVDPGVGTGRRAIVVTAAEQTFVAPDNGVLAMVYAREEHEVRAITNDDYFRKPVSWTFHGRDIFAPVGAHLAAGVPAAQMGDVITGYVRPPFARPLALGEGVWTGRVLKIDRFGNIITNFQAGDFPNLANVHMMLGAHEVHALARNYAERPGGELFAIVGSSGFLEISVAQGSAAASIGVRAGAAVVLRVPY